MSQQHPPNRPDIEPEAYYRAAQELLEKLRKTPPPPESSIQVDDERKTLEYEKLQLDNKKLLSKLEEAEDLHKVRKRYTGRLFWLTVRWLVAVVIFIGLAGFRAWDFRLSDTVIVAFITSTTVSVIGLFLIPAKWLFPAREDDKK
jgi:hypothetical protein